MYGFTTCVEAREQVAGVIGVGFLPVPYGQSHSGRFSGLAAGDFTHEPSLWHHPSSLTAEVEQFHIEPLHCAARVRNAFFVLYQRGIKAMLFLQHTVEYYNERIGLIF